MNSQRKTIAQLMTEAECIVGASKRLGNVGITKCDSASLLAFHDLVFKVTERNRLIADVYMSTIFIASIIGCIVNKKDCTANFVTPILMANIPNMLIAYFVYQATKPFSAESNEIHALFVPIGVPILSIIGYIGMTKCWTKSEDDTASLKTSRIETGSLNYVSSHIRDAYEKLKSIIKVIMNGGD